MKTGRLVGEVWATRKARGLEGRKLVLVATDAADPRSHVVVAVDPLEAREGDEVLVAFGSGARNVLAPPPNREILADAAIAQVIDGRSDREV